MKKTIIIVATGLMAMAGTTATAQNDSKLGSFFRKVGERATGMNMSDELIVTMPPELAKKIELKDVCGTGNSETGEVTVTVTVESTVRGAARLTLGGERSDFVTDTKGQRYRVTPVDTLTTGPQRLAGHSQHIYQFSVAGVPPEMGHLEMLSLGYSHVAEQGQTLASTQRGMDPVTVRNVKIEWLMP